MKRKISYEDLKKAFLDVVDGETENDIQDNTGWDMKRCKEIRKIYELLLDEEK